ncbi:exopolysaccharide biosynthesis protein, WecB/TagA/CpsF family [Rivularia sp. PCC 7116]|uniref:WecB/TagA/CpsF family glycosyltransferase n=1 Tax=Rivularia sp. PCC 7116 TaxID=373994 RepID=UPI00029F1CA7|nr:WecB/TagA/CpsF family glycosyltransferase [Rivularia sp. PCC 7116]AFY53086.1 exopolysaccharide biosynthesis protein, WecB/TagA/CpsF family [Rivularia sp. PCC 7116]
MVKAVALPTRKVLDFPITALRLNEQIQTILEWAKEHKSKTVCVANVHMLMEAHWNPEFAGVLKDADIVTPDGMPLVWMMKKLGATSQDRVAGLDILASICDSAQKQNVSLFFLGSQKQILSGMRSRLKEEYPQLSIAAMEPLPFRPLTESEDEALIQKINESGAGIVFVSLGCPKQEKWMAQHKDKIHAVMIGLGGAFPVYAGLQKRAPRIVRQSGFEWLYRWMQEPRRLWGRYTKTIPPFMWLAMKQLISTNYSVSNSASNLD